MKWCVILIIFLLSVSSFAKRPGILSFKNGSPVTLESWEERREEIKFLLQDEVYGFRPQNKISSIEIAADIQLKSIQGIYREVKIFIENVPRDKFIRLGVFLPDTDKVYPSFLSVNHCGNYTLVDDVELEIDESLMHHPVFCKDMTRGALKKKYPVEKILKAGYAFVTYDVSDMDADIATLKFDGIKAHIQTHDDPRKSWGTLIAWSWGLNKAVDYIYQDQNLDNKKIIVQGHSRRGKAALLAAAFDERINIVIPHQSGTGGTASFRGAVLREKPEMIANGSSIYPLMSEPNQLTHWFSEYFKTWSGKMKHLPIDSHLTMSLIAPRPMMDVQGTKDFWAGPDSAWKMLKKVNNLYEFLGVEGFKGKGKLGYKTRMVRNPNTRSIINFINQESITEINKNNTGNLLQYRLKTGHVQNETYWDVFIKFANLF